MDNPRYTEIDTNFSTGFHKASVILPIKINCAIIQQYRLFALGCGHKIGLR